MTGQVVNRINEKNFVPVIVKVDNLKKINVVKQLLDTNLLTNKLKNNSGNNRKFPRKTLEKTNRLLKLYQSRRAFAELQTGKAVERCQQIIQADIEKFFASKREMISTQFSGQITGNLLKEDIEKILISEAELKQVCFNCEQIIQEKLFKRFKLFWGESLDNVDLTNKGNLFTLIHQYHKTKKRTIFLTALAEEWNREAWTKTIPTFISNSLLSWIICEMDLSSVLVKGFGINTEIEKQELTEEIKRRMNGVLTSIMNEMLSKFKSQVAEVFYEIHDRLTDRKLELKMNFLAAKRSAERVIAIM